MKKQIRQRILAERAVSAGTTRLDLELMAGEEWVPAALLLPPNAAPEEKAAAALLLHGYSADKEMMVSTIGRSLAERGIASLSLDLPLHGARRAARGPRGGAFGGHGDRPSLGSAMELMRHWRAALSEAELGLSYLGARAEIERGRLAAVGYSLGSFLSGALAARDSRVKALVVAAGGDLPGGALTSFARPLMDPLENVRRLAGRPLLMVAGRRDRTVTPAQAQALFEAAGEPKELRWYDSGHILPVSAAADVAEWLAGRL